MDEKHYLELQELEEVREVARRVDPTAEVLERTTDISGQTGWVLKVQGSDLPFIEVRCLDRSRGRRLIVTSLVEVLGERGLLSREAFSALPGYSAVPEYLSYREALERDARILGDLRTVLAANESEESIQKCIERYPRIWRFISQTNPQIVPKMKLGEVYVTDFLIFGSALYSQTQMPTATFVEIERPGYRLFTRSGDESAELRHGLRQLRDWKYWVSEHKQYLRDRLVERIGLDWKRWGHEGPCGVPPYGFSEQYLLVIGRREAMSAEERLRLQRLNEESWDYKIVTFDMLCDALLPENPWPDLNRMGVL